MPRKSGPLDGAIVFFGLIILVIVGIVTVISQYPWILAIIAGIIFFVIYFRNKNKKERERKELVGLIKQAHARILDNKK